MKNIIRTFADDHGCLLAVEISPVADRRRIAIFELHVKEHRPGESLAWWFNERGELLDVRKVGRA